MELNQFRDVDIVLDKANDNIIQKQFVSAGDKDGRSLTAQLTDNGVIGEIIGAAMNLYWHNQASGLTDLSAFYVVDRATSVFKIDYPQNMLTPGKVIAYIQILHGGKVTHTKPFEITVQKLAGTTRGVLATAEYGALVTTLAKANEFEADIAEVSAQLAEKATKSDVQQISLSYKESYVTLALLQAAYPTGDIYNHTVLADNLIYTYTKNVWTSTGIQANGTGLADNSVSTNKIIGTVLGKNEFNPSTITLSKWVNPATLTVDNTDNFDLTDFIAVTVGQSYAITNARSVGHFDGTKTMISAINTSAFATFVATQPFIRVSYAKANTYTVQVEKGAVATIYEPYGYQIPTSLIKNKSITSEKFDAIVLKKRDNQDLMIEGAINCFERNTEGVITSNDYLIAKGYMSIQELEIVGISPDVPVKLWFISRNFQNWGYRFSFAKKVDGGWVSLADPGTTFAVTENTNGITKVSYTHGDISIKMRVNYNLIPTGGRFIEGSLDTEPVFVVRPECVKLTENNGTGTGEAYDQSLNTTDNVSFASVITDAIYTSGNIPKGTLASPPTGLLSGDMWIDTTDSVAHPILRVMA